MPTEIKVLLVILAVCVMGAVSIAARGGVLPPLIGGWWRTGTPGSAGAGWRMYFIFRRSAERYGTRGMSGIDPYVRVLHGPIEPHYGLLVRRSPERTNPEEVS